MKAARFLLLLFCLLKFGLNTDSCKSSDSAFMDNGKLRYCAVRTPPHIILCGHSPNYRGKRSTENIPKSAASMIYTKIKRHFYYFRK